MIATSNGLGTFAVEGTEGGHTVDLMNNVCLCKGFYYGKKRLNNGLKTCKHLDWFRDWGYRKCD